VRRPAVEREREVAERIGGVRGPVVHRARTQRLQLVVVFGAVELERVDAARAFLGIEPAFRQKHAHRVDAVLEPVHRGELQVLQSEAAAHRWRVWHGGYIVTFRMMSCAMQSS
jgi:hypothetical protein